MNIGGIYAQTSYKFAFAGKASKRRRILLKNLALAMTKQHLFSSNAKHLPQGISTFLKVNSSREVELITEEKISPPKRRVCRSCALDKKISSASMKCCRCQSFTCKKYSEVEVVCNNCKDENSDSN